MSGPGSEASSLTQGARIRQRACAQAPQRSIHPLRYTRLATMGYSFSYYWLLAKAAVPIGPLSQVTLNVCVCVLVRACEMGHTRRMHTIF